MQPETYAQDISSDGIILDFAIQKSIHQASGGKAFFTSDNKLQVASARIIEIEDLDITCYLVKILNSHTGTIYTFFYDVNVESITEEMAFNMRAAAYEARYGRLSRNLHTRVKNASASELIPVVIWAEQGVGLETIEGMYRIYLPLIMSSGTSNCGSPVDCIIEFLNSRGYTVEYASSEVPTVYTEIPSLVIEELQSQSYVSAIYEQQEFAPMLDSAARTSAAPWTWERGITGSGIKVAVLEGDGVDFDNPYVDGSQYYIDWWKREGEHATGVAGMIASTHADNKGIAYDVEILSANALSYWSHHIVAASDWAIESGAHVINASFGDPCKGNNITSIDKYLDWVVWNKMVTVVASAGNLRPQCSSNYNVTSPGKSYNIITVGSKNDKNTATNVEDTKDDQFSDFSLYVDPVTASSNRLKPEVVAVGERIKTTYATSAPWINSQEVKGTSFASPIVAGEAALMMQRSDWLKFSPEAVKAGIMATARWTELHDDQNWDQWTSIEKMGVGAIDTTAADNSLINARIQGLYLHESDFNDNHYDIDFEVTVPERIRVIIVWSSHPNRVKIVNWILHDRLESDFDLTIHAPNGQVFGSYADEVNYEIVEFMASQTGAYKARIHLSRWDDSTMEERVGFAWYSGVSLP